MSSTQPHGRSAEEAVVAAPAETFGERLRRHRVAAGLTQEALAERAGLSARGLSDLERGARRYPHPDTVRRLADALGLADADRAAFAPPARSGVPARAGLSAEPHAVGLPSPVGSFVGRESELRELRQLLASTRLLTLTGPGGIGKTRLAIEAARTRADEVDAVAFVELAPLTEPALVTQAVAGTLGVREQPRRRLIETLADALRPVRLLLVLDNCEHVVEAGAEVADALLRACPDLAVLATSRERLGVTGEVIWRVPPLSLPDPQQLSGVDNLLRYGAARLFVERARAAGADLAVTPSNASAIAEVCRRLDGIPLALELAAAWTPVLSPEQIAARLDDRFQLLTRGSRTAPARQQTLRAALDWSHDLLGDAERRCLRRLAPFGGDWTLEAAEAVCADEELTAPEVLGLLGQLVDKSLVQNSEQPTGALRYRLLATVRQYALARLGESGEADPARRRHADHYLALAERAAPGLRGGDQARWLETLEQEGDNLSTALAWLLAAPDEDAAQDALRLAAALYWFWYLHSHLGYGRRWLDAALARADPATHRTSARARALAGAGLLACLQGDVSAARAQLRDGAALARALGDRAVLGMAEHHLGLVALYEGDAAAWRAHLEASVAVFRGTDDRWGLALALVSLGHAAAQLGEDGAAALLGESLEHFRALQDRWGLARVLHCLGELARAERDDTRARALYEESLGLYRELGQHNTAGSVLHNLGYVAQHQRDAARAAACFAEGIGLHRRYGDQRNLAMCVAGLAGAVAMSGQPDRAARLLGWAEARFETLGLRPDPIDRVEVERNLSIVRAALGEAAFAAAHAEGGALTEDQVLALAGPELST